MSFPNPRSQVTNPSGSSKPHILIVDDDAELRNLLSRFLSKHGIRVTTAKDGCEMEQVLKDRTIDLIVLDLNLPGEDGFTLCRKVHQKTFIPIIMISAKGTEIDRIIALEVGADDYIAKPLNPRVLAARIKAVLRRVVTVPMPTTPVPTAADAGGEKLSFAEFELDQSARTLKRLNQMIPVTAGEYDLLIAFVKNPRRVLNRDQLLKISRDHVVIPIYRAIDVQVGRLRKKIELDPKNPTLIKTVRDAGYMFTAEVVRG